MLFHRLGTLSHILASTELTCCTKKDEFLTDEALIEKNAVEIVKQVMVTSKEKIPILHCNLPNFYRCKSFVG